jgi:hypothetical protein
VARAAGGGYLRRRSPGRCKGRLRKSRRNFAEGKPSPTQTVPTTESAYPPSGRPDIPAEYLRVSRRPSATLQALRSPQSGRSASRSALSGRPRSDRAPRTRRRAGPSGGNAYAAAWDPGTLGCLAASLLAGRELSFGSGRPVPRPVVPGQPAVRDPPVQNLVASPVRPASGVRSSWWRPGIPGWLITTQPAVGLT